MVSVSSGNIAARPSERGHFVLMAEHQHRTAPAGAPRPSTSLEVYSPDWGAFEVLGSKESKPNDPNGSDAHRS